MTSLDTATLFSVSGKTVVITGGGRGIGAMMAEGFVANGARVIISSRDKAACTETALALSAQGPGTCVAIPADLGTEAGCRTLATEIAKHTDKVHVLVNNSGTSWGASLEKSTGAAWDKVMNLNVKATFELTVALLPLLDAAATPADPARVINVGSVAGLSVQSYPTFAYDTSKAAVHHLTRKLATWLARRDGAGARSITVNAIAPGYVPTKMTAGLAVYGETDAEAVQPLPRAGQTQDMAAAALFLASPGGAWVTGVVLPVDGGLSACPVSHSVKSKL